MRASTSYYGDDAAAVEQGIGLIWSGGFPSQKEEAVRCIVTAEGTRFAVLCRFLFSGEIEVNAMNMKKIVAWVVLVLAMALPAAAAPAPDPSRASDQKLLGILDLGKVLKVPISLLNGVSGTLTVTFESVTALSLLNLGVSVVPVSPTDPALLARLPETVSISSGFPILVRIHPPAAGGLAFTGVASIELQPLTLLSPPSRSTRMYAAPEGGNFTDNTTTVQPIMLGSSYRAIGTRGGFSEFLLVIDQTPLDDVIADKLDRLDQILADNAGVIAAPVSTSLAADLAAARSHIAQGNAVAASQDLDLFLGTVEQHSGADIPNIWRAQRDLVNVAGLLRAGGQTLQFSLSLHP